MLMTGAMTRDAFGPNLRRIRLQRGISLQQIADSTKVHEDLWAALECNDVSRWPSGIFARAYVRQYARAIGVDPDSTVDEFCRWFPIGDRRAEPLVRGQAEILGVCVNWEDEGPGSAVHADRRGGIAADPSASVRGPETPLDTLFGRLRRTLGKA